MTELKLHLGCGKRYIPGFVHVDQDAYPHIDYRSDIRRLPSFGDDSVALIYACHCFNFFDDDEAVEVLAEWRRVLVPGGVLRLSVPDFEAVAKAYLEIGEVEPVKRLVTGYYQGQKETCWYRTIYDETSLRSLLERCGFVDVGRYDWRDTAHAAVDDYSQAYLPHMDKEHGRLMSLNVEARKP
jgi:predicted SAM-dependent methyltransferase